MCAPVVQESEELESLIGTVDELLRGFPTPRADGLRELVPVTEDDYVQAVADANVTSNATTQAQVLAFVRSCAGKTLAPVQVALGLGIETNAARAILSRLVLLGEIERPERGRYCYLQGQLTA
jgi:hypothetical protein